MRNFRRSLAAFIAAISIFPAAALVDSREPDICGIQANAAEYTAEELDECVNEMLKLVNEERKNAGVGQLRLNDRLCQAAGYRAVELVQVFDHVRPDGTSCETVLKDFGVTTGGAFGENILYCTSTLTQTVSWAMDRWMNSAGHRANILSDSYHDIGIGVRYYGGKFYWVQIFAGSAVENDSLMSYNISGDVDLSGIIDADDASAVLSEYSTISTGKKPDLTLKQHRIGDVNSDGFLDADDASAILSYYSHVSTGGSRPPEEFFK